MHGANKCTGLVFALSAAPYTGRPWLLQKGISRMSSGSSSNVRSLPYTSLIWASRDASTP